jgi:hypothetical protein
MPDNNLPDALQPKFIFQMTAAELLTQIVSGTIDPKELAWQELRNRGLDNTGKWVGFGDDKCEKPF